MKTIYEVAHGCGFGPYSASFHETLSGAQKFARKFLKEIKQNSCYQKRSIRKGSVFNIEVEEKRKKGQPVMVESWWWKMNRESNNENGHEYWEDDEYLEINEVGLKP